MAILKPYVLSEIAPQSVDIIINGSSSSLKGELPPLAEGYFSSGACAYDMAYGKAELPFLAWAKTQQATIK
jgi:shikimate dehydrogenase